MPSASAHRHDASLETLARVGTCHVHKHEWGEGGEIGEEGITWVPGVGVGAGHCGDLSQ